MTKCILNIIGAGLAGSEAAFQAANAGVKVRLFEMRDGTRGTAAHHTTTCAELVCSNSFRNDAINSAIGLLHEEMRMANSLIMNAATKHKVPAGGALAVDRTAFSQEVESTLSQHPNIQIIRTEITEIPQDGISIISTGPLTSEALTKKIIDITGEEQLAFFDAIAPIVYKSSIDFSVCWYQSRYDKIGPDGGGKDYINCPMNQEEYLAFVEAILESDKTEFKEWEKDTPYFDGCLPIEVMASRGVDTLRFGPMKPVGLKDPRTGQRPYAVVQLRQDNKLGTLYNIVGFQTKLKYSEQQRVLRMIPGLLNAEFARLGGIHRNTFIKSPKILTQSLQLKNMTNVRFAGQITGVEGYIESAAIGLLAGRFAAAELLNLPIDLPSRDTAMGALLSHITLNANPDLFQPMNINFGLFNPPEGKMHKDKKQEFYVNRAIEGMKKWLKM